MARVSAVKPTCKAPSSSSSSVAYASAAITTAAASVSLLAANPALALVDKRLNGDGAGLALGINDPILGWVLLGVFGGVWALYSTSVKDINPAADDDDGLSL